LTQHSLATRLVTNICSCRSHCFYTFTKLDVQLTRASGRPAAVRASSFPCISSRDVIKSIELACQRSQRVVGWSEYNICRPKLWNVTKPRLNISTPFKGLAFLRIVRQVVNNQCILELLLLSSLLYYLSRSIVSVIQHRSVVCSALFSALPCYLHCSAVSIALLINILSSLVCCLRRSVTFVVLLSLLYCLHCSVVFALCCLHCFVIFITLSSSLICCFHCSVVFITLFSPPLCSLYSFVI